jgi:hypothetical protein
VAKIISTLSVDSSILSNNFSKFKSHTNTQLIGEIAHHNI